MIGSLERKESQIKCFIHHQDGNSDINWQKMICISGDVPASKAETMAFHLRRVKI